MLTGLERVVRELDLEELSSRRWFAGKGRRPVAATHVDALDVPGSDGGALALVDLAYEDGGDERYVLPARLSGGDLVEASPDDPLWPALARLVVEERELPGLDRAFVTIPGSIDAEVGGSGRALTDDQSNTSVVVGERLVVKCYRKVLPGTHPEPELLAGLSRVGSRRAPRFAGALARRSQAGEEALVCVYAYVPGEPVGWERLIVRLRDALATTDSSALDDLAHGVAPLGVATAELHVDLATAFGTAEGTAGDAELAVAAGRARLQEALAVGAEDVLAALRPRADAARDAIGDLRLLAGAPLTRCHGDLHVAQFVDSPDGLVAVDFEGEPGRSLEARGHIASPLRDLACLLLSLDHVAVAAARRLSFGAALDAALAWSAEARAGAIEAYEAGIARSGLTLDERLLRALEVEKECHEVIYAAAVLPEWSYAPALVLPRIVGRSSREPA